jgi:SAM-dependent methyltransferase
MLRNVDDYARNHQDMASLQSSRQFWQQKALENPYWYVSSYGPYQGRNLEEFWASGVTIWNNIKHLIAYAPKPTDTVVEIGCGVGRLTRAICKEVGHVHAFDISQKMLEVAKTAELPNVTFYLGIGDSLKPLNDGIADFVLAYCVFQHLPSLTVLRAYVKEMERVSKLGAICAFTLTPRTWKYNLRFLMKLKAKIRDKLTTSGPKGLGADEWLGIRPTMTEAATLSCNPIAKYVLDGERLLFRFHANTHRDGSGNVHVP